MPDNSAILALPYIQPSQAQKHVTHNEAIATLDVLVQLSLVGFDAETPPAVPLEGETHALGAAPTGAWAGQGDMLASFRDGIWVFIAPLAGWRAWAQTPGELRVWTGTIWALIGAETDNLAGLGINTTADPTNRLSLRADATLLSHDGGGHQLKINKAAATDTASLLFQSGFTGHAEMGLNGNTDFSIKVSDDGTIWSEALAFDGASGAASGDAVQSSATDATAGRLLKVGAFGLGLDGGSLSLTPGDNLDTLTVSGLWRYAATTVGAPSSAGVVFHETRLPGARTQTATSHLGVRYSRYYTGGVWSAWQEFVLRESNGDLNVNGGALFVDAASSLVGIGETAPLYKLHVSYGSNNTVGRLTATHAAFSDSTITASATRAAAGAYSFLRAFSGGTADMEFDLRGNGNGSCDGSWTGGGADYAEYFEWADGNPDATDRRGISVVLTGDKIRAAAPGETPIGVISGNPSVIGDGDMDRWKGKYLRDDFGTYVFEDYQVAEWVETITDVDDEGRETSREIRHSYAADAIPDGLVVPGDATSTPQSRRVLNPDYDPDQTYTPRAERPEWDTVGLMGKLRLRKGQITGATWIKMRDVSDMIEEWLVR